MKKSDEFNTELNYIKDDRIRESTAYLLERLPDYFYTMPASTSGKYHPDFSLHEGGLVRHTKAAVRIAIELFRDTVFNHFSLHDQDLIIMALILHDGFKQGINEDGHTCFEHPFIVSKFIIKNNMYLSMDGKDIIKLICLINSHMGPWNIDETKSIVLPLPVTDEEKFVHLCDYLASRKFLNINFVGNEIVDTVNRGQARKLEK